MGNRSQKDTEHLLSIPEANAAAPKVSEQDKGAYKLQPGLRAVWGTSTLTEASPGENLDSHWLLRPYPTGLLAILFGTLEFKIC